MYFHIGDNDCVLARDVIGVFNALDMEKSPINLEFMQAVRQRGCVQANSDEPKSMVIVGLQSADLRSARLRSTDGEAVNSSKVILSVVSTATLAKRTE